MMPLKLVGIGSLPILTPSDTIIAAMLSMPRMMTTAMSNRKASGIIAPSVIIMTTAASTILATNTTAASARQPRIGSTNITMPRSRPSLEGYRPTLSASRSRNVRSVARQVAATMSIPSHSSPAGKRTHHVASKASPMPMTRSMRVSASSSVKTSLTPPTMSTSRPIHPAAGTSTSRLPSTRHES
jgi:hypothetical protein